MTRSLMALVLAAAALVACSHDWDAWLPSGGGASGGGGNTTSSSTSSSGVGGVGGIPDVPGSCPASEPDQTPLRKVASSLGEAVCIEETELTRGRYEAWLTNGPIPSAADVPPACDFKGLDFLPSAEWPPGGVNVDHPVVHVDWCDAWAYCFSQGRHLCGKIGGGDLAASDWQNAAESEWFAACSGAGTRPYPYGPTFQAGVCQDVPNDPPDPPNTAPVASLNGCIDVSGQVYDLSGNAWEWEDLCAGDTGALDQCRLRGGGYNNGASNALGCAANAESDRQNTSPAVGFRCCADALPD